MRAVMEDEGDHVEPRERAAEQHEHGLHDSDRHDSGTTSTNAASTKKKRYKSKYDRLDEKWSARMATLEEKIDNMAAALVPSRTTNGGENSDHVHERRVELSPEPQRHLLDQLSDYDDQISLQPGQQERREVLNVSECDSDSDKNQTKSENLSAETKKGLLDLFGEDAVLKKSDTKVGIEIDQSQKDVLDLHYRSTTPNDVTAFSEDHIDLFPVSEETDKYLQVPSLDPLIETCLVKRHGSKGSFSKNNKSGRSLVTQPCKMIEKIAYRGQQAAKFGIVIQLYMQQSLGSLLEYLQCDHFDQDQACRMVKDVFSMSTKSLDQSGRTGAFHHIIRRTATMTDTALYELDDANSFTNLPGDGVFGEEFEKLLKSRKEKKKQIDDLIPDIQKKQGVKRKSNGESEASASKKNNTSATSTSSSYQDKNFRGQKSSSWSQNSRGGRSNYCSGKPEYKKVDFGYDNGSSSKSSYSRGRGKSSKRQ